mgnify:CR=1 FL=1
MGAGLTRDEIFRAPKIDLHRHLDGAVRPELVLEMAKKFGVILPTYNLAEFKKLYQIVKPKGMPIRKLFERFAWAIAVMRTPKGLNQAAYEQVLDLARENILYAEIRFAPGYHSIYLAPWYTPATYEKNVFPTMTLDLIVELVLDGLARGMKETGISVNLTLCIPRESLSMYGPKSVSNIVDLALRFQNRGVVSLDLACNEVAFPPDAYEEFFRSTWGSKIRRNPHAGEMGLNSTKRRNIQVCVDNFQANGLGHAMPLYQSECLMNLVREKNIRIERTPLSPVPECSLADGHLDILLKHQVPVVITSDDPVLMRASLTDNWLAALNYHGLGEKEFWQLTANALNTAFYRSKAERKRVQKRFVEQGLSRSLLIK